MQLPDLFSIFKTKKKFKISKNNLSMNEIELIVRKCKENNINSNEQCIEQGIDLSFIANRCYTLTKEQLDNKAKQKMIPYLPIIKTNNAIR